MHDEVYQMYLDEISQIEPSTEQEEKELLTRLRNGDESACVRLLEGSLHEVTELARPFADQGVPMGDLIQEANMALMMVLKSWQGGDFRTLWKEQATKALEEAVKEQKEEVQVQEEMVARVNVLKKVSEVLAEELGREASVEELAAKMHMTEDEIKAIMKLTLDAMSVSPDAEM